MRMAATAFLHDYRCAWGWMHYHETYKHRYMHYLNNEKRDQTR